MVEINNRTSYKIKSEDIVRTISKIKKTLNLKKKIKLSIGFVSPAEIKKINSTYRRINKATDVLSFLLEDSRQHIEGELLICLRVARRQGQEHGLKLVQELNILLIHGFLHLLGYDHEKKQDRQRMARLEQELLNNL